VQRKKYIDFLRQIDIYYMFFYHTVLILLPKEEIKGPIDFLFSIVPFDAALFLFLAGFSLALSAKKHEEAAPFQFQNKKLKRGFLLILASTLLFFLQFGIQLPDLLFSSGILNTIGWLCIIGGSLTAIPSKKTFLSLLITGLLISTIVLEKQGIFIFPFNLGYEPWSPTIIFGMIGLLGGLIYNCFSSKKQTQAITFIIGTAGAVLLVYFFCFHDFFSILKNERIFIERRFNSALTLAGLFGGDAGSQHFFMATIWNYSISAFLASLGLVFVFFAIAYFLEYFWQKYIPAVVFLPGAHALSNYFMHLLVLALIASVFGDVVFSLGAVLVILGILYLGSYLLPLILISLKKKIKGRTIA
jgi:hypothetical protein